MLCLTCMKVYKHSVQVTAPAPKLRGAIHDITVTSCNIRGLYDIKTLFEDSTRFHEG